MTDQAPSHKPPSLAPQQPIAPEQLTTRVKVQFTPSQEAELKRLADSIGMTVAGYVRSLVLAEIDAHGPNPAAAQRRARKHDIMLRVAELHSLAMQVKRLGTNLNQMAKQANTGMVPLTRAEITYMLNQHQLLMSNAIAAVEKLLA